MSGVETDLIAAVATPPGQGGVGIVRLSGQGALEIARKLCGGVSLTPRTAQFANLVDGDELIDEGLVIAFPAPRSFTGEDVVEFQCHGSPVVLQRLLDSVCRCGARIARPGEFSERAFLNGKIDLAQAEAIADLIASASVQASRAALRSLKGEFSARVTTVFDALTMLRVLVEASIDFPEEEEDFLAEHNISDQLCELRGQIDRLIEQARQGIRQQAGFTLALLGLPNAGKSSLLNALSGEDTAIVTDIPGTTRDLLKVDLVIEGLPIRLIDTAGLRDTSDRVETAGVERAKSQAEIADIVVMVLDATRDLASQRQEVLRFVAMESSDGRLLEVFNKADLVASPSCADGQIWLSARTGFGIDTLKCAIAAFAGFKAGEAPFTARARHVAALVEARQSLDRAMAQVGPVHGTEILAEELKAAHDDLGEILGKVSPDELLGKIFSEFCIGK